MNNELKTYIETSYRAAAVISIRGHISTATEWAPRLMANTRNSVPEDMDIDFDAIDAEVAAEKSARELEQGKADIRARQAYRMSNRYQVKPGRR